MQALRNLADKLERYLVARDLRALKICPDHLEPLDRTHNHPTIPGWARTGCVKCVAQWTADEQKHRENTIARAKDLGLGSR